MIKRIVSMRSGSSQWKITQLTTRQLNDESIQTWPFHQEGSTRLGMPNAFLGPFGLASTETIYSSLQIVFSSAFYPMNLMSASEPGLKSAAKHRCFFSQKIEPEFGSSPWFSGISISILFIKLTIHHPRMQGLSRWSGILHVNGCATGTLHSDSEKQYDAATLDSPKANLRSISVSQHAVYYHHEISAIPAFLY